MEKQEKKRLGYIGIDQYGQHYHIKKHPRKELLEQTGYSNARKMFVDKIDGSIKHVGYVMSDLWINVYQLVEF